MARDGEVEADRQAYDPGLAFSIDDARAILNQLSKSGATLPTRFVRPEGLSADRCDDPVPLTLFPLINAWSAASREFQDALNTAASGAKLFGELSSPRGKRERELKGLRNATWQILNRLREPPPDMIGNVSKFDPVLRDALSERLGPFPEAEAIIDVISQVERLHRAIKELQENDDHTRMRMAALLEKNSHPQFRKTDDGKVQPYRIKCYTSVFVTVLKLEPRDHCNKTTENYNGAFPDFIRRTLQIETGADLGAAALTKALQRSRVLDN